MFEYEGECNFQTIVENNQKIREINLDVHLQLVRRFCNIIASEVILRAKKHDFSKISEEEFQTFKEYVPLLKGVTYGSPEYKVLLEQISPATKHHYKENRHHPEHFENGIKEMHLVDVVEMLCDWFAATTKHADGDIYKSIEINQKRFGYSDELKHIFLNTVEFIKEKDITDLPVNTDWNHSNQ